jgi:hypothetical protein
VNTNATLAYEVRCWDCSVGNADDSTCQIAGIIPTAQSKFTIAPLLKVPPASRGEPKGLGSPCLQGEP